jgi:hypothetical protein
MCSKYCTKEFLFQMRHYELNLLFSIQLQMQSRQMVHPIVMHLLALLILCTKGDGFTLFEALNSTGYVLRNFNELQIFYESYPVNPS